MCIAYKCKWDFTPSYNWRPALWPNQAELKKAKETYFLIWSIRQQHHIMLLRIINISSGFFISASFLWGTTTITYWLDCFPGIAFSRTHFIFTSHLLSVQINWWHGLMACWTDLVCPGLSGLFITQWTCATNLSVLLSCRDPLMYWKEVPQTKVLLNFPDTLFLISDSSLSIEEMTPQERKMSFTSHGSYNFYNRIR